MDGQPFVKISLILFRRVTKYSEKINYNREMGSNETD